jgi:hypothetical protein
MSIDELEARLNASKPHESQYLVELNRQPEFCIEDFMEAAR